MLQGRVSFVADIYNIL